MPDFQEGSKFWHFSLRLYQHSDTQKECLRLQKVTKSDVNFILFGLYLADQAHEISTHNALQLEKTLSNWRASYIRPLRSLRQKLKEEESFPEQIEAKETIRNYIKKAELLSEKLQQEIMAGSYPIKETGQSTASVFRHCAQINLVKLCRLPITESDKMIELALRFR